MSAKAIMAWSAGALATFATAAFAAAALVGDPFDTAIGTRPLVAAAAVSPGTAAPSPVPDPDTTILVVEVPPVPPIEIAGIEPPAADPATQVAPVMPEGEPVPSFLATDLELVGLFNLRPALGMPGYDGPGGWPALGEATLAPSATPAGSVAAAIVREEMAARDVTVARAGVLPPPRPAFREARLVPGAGAFRDLGAGSEPAPETPAWPEMSEDLSHAHKTLGSGFASWYGPGFHGRRTASGEVFNQNDLTAAHRFLPFGTRVRVVDQRTGRSIVVRINDRGPFAHGRVIDLSKASAQALGISGLTRVRIVSAE